jgi:hypothetical protein
MGPVLQLGCALINPACWMECLNHKHDVLTLWVKCLQPIKPPLNRSEQSIPVSLGSAPIALLPVLAGRVLVCVSSHRHLAPATPRTGADWHRVHRPTLAHPDAAAIADRHHRGLRRQRDGDQQQDGSSQGLRTGPGSTLLQASINAGEQRCGCRWPDW